VYLFDWKILKQYLIDDEADPNSSNDFGKNIIPNLLADGKKLFAYQFDGYWKDVGTLQSLWEANMDLLDPSVPIELKDKDYKIYARNYAEPPSLITKSAEINNSFIAEGCTIKGSVKNSVISTGCKIAEDAIVINSVIMPDVEIKSGAVVKYAIIGQESVVGMNAKVGEIPTDGASAKEDICVVGKNTIIAAGDVVGQ